MTEIALPAWEPHPDVWLVLGLLVAAYATAIARVGPRHVASGAPVVRRGQVVCFAAGVAALWIASDWPVHDIAENNLFSVHMVQHLLEMLVAPPLLLLGTPAWMLRLVLSPPGVLRVVRGLTRFLPATILFNVVVVVTHVPFAIEWQLTDGFVHFLFHATLLVSSIIVWMPIVSPLPEVPRFSPPLRMIFLFMQGIVPTVPASFLTFGDRPLYRVYEELPRLWGISALDDMRLGGLIMKLVAGVVLWVVIATIFFRWYGEEEMQQVPRGMAPLPEPDLTTHEVS